MIHYLADVQSQQIGEGTRVWQFTVILPDAVIGRNCNINCHVFIENDVLVGDNVTIKSGVFLWDGLRIRNNVFVGPRVTFTNDKFPRSKQYPAAFQQTIVEHHASIGAGAIVLGGITIGAFATVAAGALVTKDVPERALVLGAPARVVGWLNDDGTPMEKVDDCFVGKDGLKYCVENNKLRLC